MVRLTGCEGDRSWGRPPVFVYTAGHIVGLLVYQTILSSIFVRIAVSPNQCPVSDEEGGYTCFGDTVPLVEFLEPILICRIEIYFKCFELHLRVLRCKIIYERFNPLAVRTSLTVEQVGADLRCLPSDSIRYRFVRTRNKRGTGLLSGSRCDQE